MTYDEIRNLVNSDVEIDQQFLHLTPNENIMSAAAAHLDMGNIASRYNFGPAFYGEKFTLYHSFTSLAKNGINTLVDTTQRQLGDRFGAAGAILAPLSGLHAMMTSMLTMTRVGDIVYSLDPVYGGHFATIGIIENTGRVSRLLPMDRMTLDIDYAALESELATLDKPVCVYIDMSYSLIPFDIARIRAIIGVEGRLMFDASHVLGLILGGVFPNPLDAGADIITANTHKTLPGAHKGLILCKTAELYRQVDDSAHGYYSSTHLDHTISLCVSIQEMLAFGNDYAQSVVRNAQVLASELTDRGIICRRADENQWTYTHQVHMMTDSFGDVAHVAKRLFNNNISVAFDDKFEQGVFVRLGVQEITRRGASERDMSDLAEIIARAISGEDLRNQVESFKSRLTGIHYSFDDGDGAHS